METDEGGRWVEALDLEPGMWLLDGTASLVRVASVVVSVVPSEITYNLTVAEDHNYFAAGILVHNGPDDSPPVPPAPPSPEQLLGIKHSGDSAHESAKAIQREQAKAARRLNIPGVRIDIPVGDITVDGNFPHAHGVGWSVNIDGELHDAANNVRAVPVDVKKALRSVGWGC